jgi:hypothetical protein
VASRFARDSKRVEGPTAGPNSKFLRVKYLERMQDMDMRYSYKGLTIAGGAAAGGAIASGGTVGDVIATGGGRIVGGVTAGGVNAGGATAEGTIAGGAIAGGAATIGDAMTGGRTGGGAEDAAFAPARVLTQGQGRGWDKATEAEAMRC